MSRKPFYFPELDALRTLAVALTLVAHFFPAVGWPLLPYSWYGVDIFFSISGFLITYILLLTRAEDANGLHVVKNFVIRRTLRLFPIYYLFLLFFFLAWKFLHLQMWKPDYTPWFFTYTPNFLFYQKGMEFAPGFSHLWSLGVEEQFYLFWPWLVVFLNRKGLLVAIILFIITGVCTHVLGYNTGDVRLLPFGNFHTLGVGSLLAYVHHYYLNSQWYKKGVRYRSPILAGAFILLVLVLTGFREGSALWQLLRESILMVTTLSFVLVSIHGWPVTFAWLTRHSWIQYLGRICYGIYLYHLPVPYFFIILKDKTGVSVAQPMLQILLYTGTTILFASISYRFIERWFLQLKERFD